jgi:hypothetical protein
MPDLRLLMAILCLPLFSLSQNIADGSAVSTDIRRVQLNEDIDRIQKNLSSIPPKRIDSLQSWLESNPALDHRLKYKYLSGIRYLLEDLVAGKVSMINADNLIDAYHQLMENDIGGISIESAVKKYTYEINRSLLGDKTVFYENAGLTAAKTYLYGQYLKIHPEQILTSISAYLNEEFVDEALTRAARLYPNDFYNYSSALQTPLSKRMRLVKDTSVQLLCRLSADSSGRLLFPFLHAFLSTELSYDTVKMISVDGKKFYRLLVNTQIHYQDEIERGNPPIVYQEIFKLLKRKASEIYINQINGMHDEPDVVRFKILEGLSPEELYYLIISSEDIIYTSSYVGVFQRMMNGLVKQTSDQLLSNVHFDGFRKFIKMAADYNKLDDFIKAMKPTQAALMIKDFVAGLEYDRSLENAVDVANGFSSINNPQLKQMIDAEVNANLQMLKSRSNENGIRIYETLQLLLKAEKDSGKSFSQKYQLDVPYFLAKEKLKTGERFIEQLFFYGDKDGKTSFQNFISFFKYNKQWKVLKNEKWYEIKSIQGKPISIFANIPFDNSNGEDLDADAQASLSSYLIENDLSPAIVVHRGHSYHLPSTIAQLATSAKLVILGSCGSYQHLHSVLDICPSAQIISSREVGSLSVNDPMLRAINEQIRLGKDIDWIRTWKNLETQMKASRTKNRFDNYVAPHKNLGLLLLQALNNN